ncbi:hypothetical protein VTL71DRAFT_5573 [Oculimacula yallundae]|uniref:Condensation domain-containing protein n=1 Tax=Oculimacula yallundae TaxID=86028 RepID=A0ABR4C1H5_9HELO
MSHTSIHMLYGKENTNYIITFYSISQGRHAILCPAWLYILRSRTGSAWSISRRTIPWKATRRSFGSNVWKQCYNDPKLDWAAAPGPMFGATLSYVEDKNCAGLVHMAQHATYDDVSLEMFLQDLDAALTDPSATLPSRVPYKAWADSYQNLRGSKVAQHSIAWHAERLKYLSNHKQSLFPEQQAVEWFKGNSEGWIDLLTGKPGPARTAIDGGKSDGVIGIRREVQLTDSKAFKAEHNVEVPQIVKATLAVVNTRRTASNIALFGQYKAGRSWPFLRTGNQR